MFQVSGLFWMVLYRICHRRTLCINIFNACLIRKKHLLMTRTARVTVTMTMMMCASPLVTLRQELHSIRKCHIKVSLLQLLNSYGDVTCQNTGSLHLKSLKVIAIVQLILWAQPSEVVHCLCWLMFDWLNDRQANPLLYICATWQDFSPLVWIMTNMGPCM